MLFGKISVPVVTLDYGNLKELKRLLIKTNPTVLFHLASIADSGSTHLHPTAHKIINLDFVRNVFELISSGDVPSFLFIQASTSEIFSGHIRGVFSEQSESRPRNHYGESKALAREVIQQAHHSGINAKSAILFSHESPIRPTNFLSRKVTQHVAHVAQGGAERLVIRDFESRRDWGHADDYARAIAMMQQGEAPEYVISSGQSHSVRDLCRVAFGTVNLDYEKYVVGLETMPSEAIKTDLVGDSKLIKSELGWFSKFSFDEMISQMVRYDLALLRESGKQ